MGYCSRIEACNPYVSYRHVPGSRTTVCRTGLFGDTVCATRRSYPSCDIYYGRPRYYTPCYPRSSCDRAAAGLFLGMLGLGCFAAALAV